MPKPFRCALAVTFVVAVAGSGAANASNDPFFQVQWALARIGAPAAWQRSTGRGIVVAVLDTGVDANHPDLRGKVLPGRDFVDPQGTAQDRNGHGTHMAGTIAADTGNGIGIAGVAPGATILPVRILDSSGESDKPSVVADGIRWAVAHGADVVNLSLAEDEQGGGSQSGDLLSDKDIEDAIVYATSRGVAAVIAAGNTDGGGRPRTSYVAGAPGAIVVGASTIDDKRAAYSNYGPGLDVLAPGGGSGIDPSFSHGCTQTNSVIGLYWDPRTRHSDYAGACGTSVAVAHVSGVVALLMAEGYSAAGAVLRIEQTTVDLAAPGKDSQTGWGRLDAARAVGPGPALHGPAGDPRHIRIAVGGAGATAAAVVSASPASPPASALAITPRGRGRGVAVAVAFVLAVAVAGARGVLMRARGG